MHSVGYSLLEMQAVSHQNDIVITVPLPQQITLPYQTQQITPSQQTQQITPSQQTQQRADTYINNVGNFIIMVVTFLMHVFNFILSSYMIKLSVQCVNLVTKYYTYSTPDGIDISAMPRNIWRITKNNAFGFTAIGALVLACSVVISLAYACSIRFRASAVYYIALMNFSVVVTSFVLCIPAAFVLSTMTPEQHDIWNALDGGFIDVLHECIKVLIVSSVPVTLWFLFIAVYLCKNCTVKDCGNACDCDCE